MTTVTAYIGLGSNLGQPAQTLHAALQALAALPKTRVLTCSPFYGSKAIGPGDQPDYVNAVAALDTALSPHALLDALQSIEAAHGRERTVRWGARTLDLDVLLYGNAVIHDERLQVPHPRLAERAFVLVPLADIAPDLPLPITPLLPKGDTVASLLARCPRNGLWSLPTEQSA